MNVEYEGGTLIRFSQRLRLQLGTSRRSSSMMWVERVIGLSVLTSLLLLGACDSEQAPVAEPTPVAATEVISPAVTVDDTVMHMVTVEPTPASSLAETPLPAASGSMTESAAAAYAPLVVDEGAGCQIESDLDLTGYPDLEQEMGCALETARYDPIALNEFGPGPNYDRFMLWFSWEQQIYVLFPDGTWITHADTWKEGDPTFSCNPFGGEPTSPPLPRRGFGKLWCDEKEVQQRMGTITREERLCQHAVLQSFEAGRVLACFEDATIRYFRLFDDHTWRQNFQR